jgi:hypothetical protein
MGTGNEAQEEHKRKDTKGRAEAKKITKTAKMRVLYWKVGGLRKKEAKFWEYVRQLEIVGLVETWVEERSWEKIEKNTNGNVKGQNEERKRKSCWGNNNRGETGD